MSGAAEATYFAPDRAFVAGNIAPAPGAGETSYFAPERGANLISPPSTADNTVVVPTPTAETFADPVRSKQYFQAVAAAGNNPYWGDPSYEDSNAPGRYFNYQFIPRTRSGAESGSFNYGQPGTGELSYFNRGGLTRGSGDEFVVPADVVSGLGNGSTSAGAKQLYAMMDNVRNTRTGKKSQPREINARKMMPV